MSLTLNDNVQDEQRIQFLEVMKIIPENINRVWYFARNAALTPILDPSFVSQITLTKGINTWTMGNEYQGYWIGVSDFKSKCIMVKNDTNEKIIEWRIDLSINLSFFKTIHLYKVTDNDTTLLSTKMVQVISQDSISVFREDEKKFYVNLYTNLIVKLAKYMKENESEISNYESCIVNQNPQRVFNFLINLNNAPLFGEYIAKRFEDNGNMIIPGTFIKGIKDNNETVYLRIKKVENDIKNSTWKFSIQTFGTNNKLPKQEIELNVIRLNNNYCQISFLHIFEEIVERQNIYHLAKEKKSYLKRIKEYLETKMLI